jgi:hypothetical protein
MNIKDGEKQRLRGPHSVAVIRLLVSHSPAMMSMSRHEDHENVAVLVCARLSVHIDCADLTGMTDLGASLRPTVRVYIPVFNEIGSD